MIPLTHGIVKLLPAQIGLFVSFHPVIAPTLIALGVFGLMYWFISDNVLPFLFRDSLPLGIELVITTPISLGGILIMYAVTAEAKIFWAFILIVGLMGKIIQGGITVYAVRKIYSYLKKFVWAIRGVKSKIQEKLAEGESNKNTNTVSMIEKARINIFNKLIRMLVRLALYIGITGITMLLVHSVYSLPVALAVDWSLIVGIGTLITLLSNTRHIRHDVGIPAVVGIIFCVVGTEVYEYPERFVPMRNVPLVSQAFEIAYQTIKIGPIGFNLSPLEIVVLTLNPIAYGLGILLAIVCWNWAPNPSKTAFSSTYRR